MPALTSSSKLHYYPILLGFSFTATLTIPYAIAVSLDHIQPFFVEISVTGTYAPESCIFCLLMCITSLLLVEVVYIRYKQIQEFFLEKNDDSKNCKNLRGLIIGLIAALGVAFVGIFQLTIMGYTHLLGAFMAFFGGIVYQFYQTTFTFLMLPRFATRGMGYFRLSLNIAYVTCVFLYYGGGLVFCDDEDEDEKNKKRKPQSPTSKAICAASVISQWMLPTIITIYFLTFIPEFKQISFEPTRIKPFHNPGDENLGEDAINAPNFNSNRGAVRAEAEEGEGSSTAQINPIIRQGDNLLPLPSPS